MGSMIWTWFIGIGAALNLISLVNHVWYYRTYGIARAPLGRVGSSIVVDVLMIAGLTLVTITAATDHNLLLTVLAAVGLISTIADAIVVATYSNAVKQWRAHES